MNLTQLSRSKSSSSFAHLGSLRSLSSRLSNRLSSALKRGFSFSKGGASAVSNNGTVFEEEYYEEEVEDLMELEDESPTNTNLMSWQKPFILQTTEELQQGLKDHYLGGVASQNKKAFFSTTPHGMIHYHQATLSTDNSNNPVLHSIVNPHHGENGHSNNANNSGSNSTKNTPPTTDFPKYDSAKTYTREEILNFSPLNRMDSSKDKIESGKSFSSLTNLFRRNTSKPNLTDTNTNNNNDNNKNKPTQNSPLVKNNATSNSDSKLKLPGIKVGLSSLKSLFHKKPKVTTPR